MSAILLIITATTLYIDISRHYNPKIKVLVEKFLGKLLRSTEKNGDFNFSGASYMAGGLFLTCLLFPQGLTITSWLILIISDCLAAIIGIKFGAPLSNGKSLAGTIAFFVSTIFISMISYFFIGYNTSFFVILVSSAATTAVEFYSKKIMIDDNFSIPITYALTTALGVIIL